jgi:predicted ATPase/DNA-binding winged helix-turn-helix (wHTH) protein
MKSPNDDPLELQAEPPDTPARPEYRFAEFRLLPRERQLFRHGEALALTARAFDVLVLLVQRSGRLVSKDELMERVWAGLIVEDNNIAVQVAQLRKLLGARAIANISGVGYRLTIPLQDEGAPSPAGEPEPRPADVLGNLPARIPPLIGRERERAELDAWVGAHPLVTVVGAAGVGKTHLAMATAQQQASRFPDGVFWVELAPLTEAAQVLPALLRILCVRPGGDGDLRAALLRRLKPLKLLLVLDNAEHLIEEVERVAEALVQGTQHLALVVTSQIPLHSPIQQVFRLGPLEVPSAQGSAEEARRCGALQLLAQRAAGAGSPLAWDDASAVVASDICRELDGNALAIELAAARLPSLGLAGLASRLHQRLGLLAPSSQASPSRRNALAVAFDWSHGLLNETEQRVFRRLAVFPGSFELDWAAQCLEDDSLPAARIVEVILDLVDRSLVNLDRANAPRYRLLETGRLYAMDKLAASGEAATVRLTFARGMRRLLDAAYEEHWTTPPQAWAARWAPEVDNVDAAFEVAREAEFETAVALYGSAWPLWLVLLQHAEARARGELLSKRLAADIPALLAARFWEGVTRANSTEYPQLARETAQRAAHLYTELGDLRGQYLAWSEYAFNWRVDHPDARRAMALAKAVENPRWPAIVLSRGRTTEATLDTSAGHVDRALALMQSVLELCERDGDTEGVLRAGANIADVERVAGRVDEAVARGEAMLPLIPRHGASPAEFSILGNLIGALVAQGNLRRACEVVDECARRRRRIAVDTQMWCALDAIALLQALGSRWQAAGQLAGAADRAYRDHGQHSRQPNEMADRARLDALLGEHVDEATLARWKAEGEALDRAEVWQLALDVSALQFDAAAG